MKSLIKAFRRLCSTLIMIAFRVFPINPKKIVFSSYFCTSLSDNPWEIFQAMKKIHPELTFIWLLKEPEPVEGGISVKSGTITALYHLATAKCWIDNSRKRSWVVKRKKQFYVQTWHGNISFKHVEADVEDKLPKLYVKAAKNDSKMADLFISGSKWATNCYRRCFWYNGEILEIGLPRSDVFYKDFQETNKKVDNWLRGESNIRYILYAPTFRVDDSLLFYMKDFSKLISVVKDRFGGEWKVMMRLHPRIAEKHGLIDYDKDVVDVSKYPNINELIVRSEIMISDYSSCMFDAMEAGKYVFLYVPDLDAYMKDRGCEFELSELPFPICKDQVSLYHTIENTDFELSKRNANIFMEKCGVCDGPDSSDKVASYILNKIID